MSKKIKNMTTLLFILLYILSITSFINLVRLTLKPLPILRKKWIEMIVSAVISVLGFLAIFLLLFIRLIINVD